MKLNKSLLLVVDVQQGFINKNTQPVIPIINVLSSIWEARGWPIIYSRFINLPGSNYERLLDWQRLQKEPETLLAKDLQVKSPFIFKKSTYTAWTTEAIALCQSQSIRDVVIVGVDTNECVLATALSVFDAGFTPWIAVDACASMGGKGPHDMAVKLFETLIGKQQLVNSRQLLTN